jgi:hypothetical protein
MQIRSDLALVRQANVDNISIPQSQYMAMYLQMSSQTPLHAFIADFINQHWPCGSDDKDTYIKSGGEVWRASQAIIYVESRCCLEVHVLTELMPENGEAHPPSKRALRIGSCHIDYSSATVKEVDDDP